MKQRSGGRGCGATRTFLIWLFATAAPAGALAQPVSRPANESPPAPAASVPAPSPFVPQIPEDVATDARGGDTLERISNVIVVADTTSEIAVPPPHWKPPEDTNGRFALRHQPGQALDAQWVQAQFDAAAGGGGLPSSTAVALVQLINRAFITAGFINSGVLVGDRAGPGGTILNLRLVFGRLSAGDAGEPAVTVEWDNDRSGGLSADYVRERFSSASAQPLNAFALERDFRLLDESSAIQSINAALRPGSQPGEASLHLIVNPADRYDVYMGASNDRSPSVGGDRLFSGGYFRNLLSSGDLLSAEGGITRGIEDGQISYNTPFFATPLSLSLLGSFNNAAVITSALAPLDIRAKDRSAEVGLAYRILQQPLMVRGGLSHWSASESLEAGVYFLHRRQRSFLFGQPFSFAPGSVNGRSEFDALRLSGNYLRRDQSRVIALSLGATVGLGGTRSDIPGIPNPHQNFGALLGQLNFAQRLGSAFELRGRLTGQHSRGILYSGLRLAIGGATTVRGYRENLFLVDRGVIASLELAHNFSISGERQRNGFEWGAFTASVFADGAAFRNAERPQPETKSIGSLGAALAWTPSPAFEANIAYGHALRDVAVPGKDSLQDRGIHFQIIFNPLAVF